MTRQLFLSSLALLAAGIHANAQAPASLSSLPASSYEHVYRHVRHLQAADNAAAVSGHPTNLSAYYRNLAGLTQPQADAMQTLALAALAELEPLDQQAQTLILQARAQGKPKLLPGQKPPAPPAQLAVLQTARKAVLTKYHANLAQALGQAAFTRLDQALIANFKVGPTASNQGSGH
jgi:hypothetical protein